MKLGTKTKTERGFELVEFKDCYGADCSLQQSSSGEENRIWLGVDDATPKVLAQQAAMVGVKTNETTGWVDYPVPEQVMMSTRMHLNEKQVKALIKSLEHWLKTGRLK